MSELYHPRQLSPALWTIAGIVAIALHAGGVGLALVSKQPDDQPDLGAPAIEIGVELTSPRAYYLCTWLPPLAAQAH